MPSFTSSAVPVARSRDNGVNLSSCINAVNLPNNGAIFSTFSPVSNITSSNLASLNAVVTAAESALVIHELPVETALPSAVAMVSGAMVLGLVDVGLV
ncbi:MAG: hypothetical protein EBW87_01045, partial [Burkholderiaceae bacterium]|nr:hypothetical protein [Burkholderiaceae bacterium]